MFILELTYTVPLERATDLLPEHMTWLEKHYAAGVFVASGRKVPRDGGIILAVAPDRSGVEEIIATDPFVLAEVCEYRVTEFVPTRVTADLEHYRETLTEQA